MCLEPEEMQRELERLRNENAELRRRLGISVSEPTHSYKTKPEQRPLNVNPIASLTADSPSAEKVALFQNLSNPEARQVLRGRHLPRPPA